MRVLAYSWLMLLGILFSQWIDLSYYRYAIQTATLTALGYIMIEVGLEFVLDKTRLISYGKDYLIAMTAAAFPWIFCSLWIWYWFDVNLVQATIVGRFAAPTSAGILFTMLAAAGLATTWVFKKARILAILDDLDTILLIIPLQMMHVGLRFHALLLVAIIIGLLVCAYRFLHVLRLPVGRGWLLGYALVLVFLCEGFEHTTLVNIEILLPAFVLGCMLVKPHDPHKIHQHAHEHAYIEPEKKGEKRFDRGIKLLYMFLVGCSLPKIPLNQIPWVNMTGHLVALTLLSNLGKIYPMFCYKKEATLRERIALSIAMWPRGEVGAGVLLISATYALPNIVVQVAELSLILNMALTGFFIYIVVWMLRHHPKGST